MRFAPVQRVPVLAVVLSAAAITMGGCEPLENGDKSVSISGQVIDAETAIGLDSASLYIHDTTDVSPRFTDSLGNFTMYVFPFSDSKIFARKEGYRTAVVPIVDATRDITGLVISLEN